MNTIKYCALPECGKPFTNWRSSCCCKSHQGIFSAKSRHGTLGKPNISKEELKIKAKDRKILNQEFIGPKKPKEKRVYTKKVKTSSEYITIEERKAKWAAYIANRKKKRDQSMPAWADKDKILEFYIEARKLTKETGILHEVDHIIPSNHKLVCGLHNEFNLQILTKDENRKKSNKFKIE